MGVVYLVGAGPGDPGLLTRRGAGLLRRADVVVHDALIDPRLLALARSDARVVDVGKRCGGRRTEQECITELLIETARSADLVVRLKGGDPFVFGRGGEEAVALRAAGVACVVVPGVTAGIGASAYAGIPLTHRGVASSVTFVSGHPPADSSDDDTRWRELARAGGTIVVYMAVSRLARVTGQLLEGGLAPTTPAAVIESATYAHQRTIAAPLARIAARATDAGVGAPALLVVGDVVALRTQLGYAEERPLAGRRVLVARARAQRSRVATRLRAAGAEVIEHPRLRARRIPHVTVPLGPAGRWDWIALSSVGAVAWLLAELRRQGLDVRALLGTRLAALGGATSAALRRRGLRPDLARDTYVPGDVLAGFGSVQGARILWPRARGASSAIARALSGRGADVREIEPFAAVPVASPEVPAEIDAIVLASSSAAAAIADAGVVERGAALVAAIGPETARTARGLGFAVDLVADTATPAGLIRALALALGRAERPWRTPVDA